MKKEIRKIVVNDIEYEWKFSGTTHIWKKGSHNLSIALDTGWYDVWGYITDLVKPEGTPYLQITPKIIKEVILFSLDNGWGSKHKKIDIKYIDNQFYANLPESTNNTPDLEAEIYYLTEEEDGRKTPVMQGYRGQFCYNGRNWDAPQVFMDKETCNPGEMVSVLLQTIHPLFHWKKFFIGKTFQIREGAKVVGKGKIGKILKPEFEIPNFEKNIKNALYDFNKEVIEPLNFHLFLVKTEKYKTLSQHFFNTLEDMQNVFEELEKQEVLLQISKEEYKALNYGKEAERI